MPRFVLLRHECPPGFEKPSHWDFMLEWAGVLRTWELQALPAVWARALGISKLAAGLSLTETLPVEAIALPDHRLAYLDYEGPISGDRGQVSSCDRGTYELLDDGPAQLTLRLTGEFLVGTVQLKLENSSWKLLLLADDRIS